MGVGGVLVTATGGSANESQSPMRCPSQSLARLLA
jgi:hypothetical protein